MYGLLKVKSIKQLLTLKKVKNKFKIYLHNLYKRVSSYEIHFCFQLDLPHEPILGLAQSRQIKPAHHFGL